jgi:hypothetical protein
MENVLIEGISMYSRFFNITVCLMWLSTMTWLITQKVAPSLWVGKPPNYMTILEAHELNPTVGWTLWLNNRQLGWALSTLEYQYQGPKEIHSWVHFDELPLQELTSGWSRALLKLIEQPTGKLTMDVKSTLTIDTLGKLLRFDSRVELDPYKSVLHMQGIVDKLQLRVEIRSGDFSYTTDVPLPQQALITDSISPQSQLPNLAKGQAWTVPAVSPLRPSNNLMELLQATVEGEEQVMWNEEPHDVWLVVYRSDPAVSFKSDYNVRGRLWVLADGDVIKQQIMIFDSILLFERMSRARSEWLMKKCKELDERDD